MAFACRLLWTILLINHQKSGKYFTSRREKKDYAGEASMVRTIRRAAALAATVGLLTIAAAHAADAKPTIDTGDTAWLLEIGRAHV